MIKILAFGTFDIIHPGHIYYLKKAKGLGDFLTVIIARDKNVEKIKGLPVNNEDVRLKNIKKLDFVDEVILGDLNDPYKNLVQIMPDIIALGYDQIRFTNNLEEKLIDIGLKNVKIIRIDPYMPDKYKSSIIKRNIKQ